jgi:molybdopterin/thiamine biosynthesis adenylyltransferase
MDILPPEKLAINIHIVGAGAIGSQVAMCLAKMGFDELTVYDFDKVDEENVNCQWYGPGDIGKLKGEALRENVERLSGTTIDFWDRKVDAENKLNGLPDLLVAAVDSMKVRQELWAQYKDSGIRWYIDPRMSAEEGLVYLVDLRDEESMKRYEASFYSDDEAVEENCTAKSTMYCAMMLSGQVAKLVKDIAVEDKMSHTIQWNIREDAYLSYGRSVQ